MSGKDWISLDSGRIYRVKSKGPSTDPCGTPQVTGIGEDSDSPICTEEERFER